MRVLVIEDERTLAGFIEQALRRRRIRGHRRHDGRAGQAAALTGDYALVLLDLTLPGKDGLEVLRAIRARLPGLPVSPSPRAQRSSSESKASTAGRTTT